MNLRQLGLGVLGAALLIAPCGISQTPARQPLPLKSAVQDKNFYLLTALQSDPRVLRVLQSNPALKQLIHERQQRLQESLRTCSSDVPCLLKPLFWSSEEINIVSSALENSDEASRQALARALRSSGAYELDQDKSDSQFLASAWALCANGMNGILHVYGEGAKPRYPKIDSMSLHPDDAAFQQQVSATVATVSKIHESLFAPSLQVALKLLNLNHRDEAGRFEPMEKGVNLAAVHAAAAVDWSRYPYSVIVVPGEGPEDPNTALDPTGHKRVALAVAAYHEGLAPFLLVSGGYVHPSQTRFAEAMEMKKALLQEFSIPESAILVDPHARHTTTNMRNSAREIYRYGMPMDKPAVVISDPAQTAYIAGAPFADRCRKELGYVPYTIVKQLSDTRIAFLPVLDSLEQNPLDPLDP
jgi:hypothetical protein